MYDFLILDTYNIAHRIFFKTESRTLAMVSQKLVFLSFIKKYMEYIDLLKNRFGAPGCAVYNLFDNPQSKNRLKHDITQSSISRIRYKLDPMYKANRRQYPKEFYTSIRFIKFLFSIKGPEYFTVLMPNLEADDLVKPLISERCGEGKTLMISTDMDWCRYLSPFVHVLSGGVDSPLLDITTFVNKYKFRPTEEKIILYKILFGDRVDNIRPVFPAIPKDTRLEMVQNCQSIRDLYSFKFKKFEEYRSTLEECNKDMRIAYQLLSAIPIESNRINHYIIKGRDVPSLQKAVNNIFDQFEENKSPPTFSFGNLKCPRL